MNKYPGYTVILLHLGYNSISIF